MARIIEKEKAQSLRKKGYSIKEISDSLHIGKSTISFWCRNIPLTAAHLKRLGRKQKNESIKNLLLVAEKRRGERLKQTAEQQAKGKEDVGTLSKRDILILGLGLYWGEGYKKGNDECGFTNSDPFMVKMFLKWLKETYSVSKDNLILRISINRVHVSRINEVTRYWSDITGVPIKQFTQPSLIKSTLKKNYANHKEHFGTLRIKVRRGANLRRRILGSLEKLGEQV